MKIVTTEQGRGKRVTLQFSVMWKNCNENTSRVFNIDDLAEIRFKFDSFNSEMWASLSFRKHVSAQDAIVTLDVNSEVLKYSQQWTCTDHWIEWEKIGSRLGYDENYNNLFLKVIPINITVNEAKSITAESIYQDTDWTDFILSATDGSISVHKSCMAVHSDVFKTMLGREWKESTEGRLQMEGVTLKTLQNLKRYMYLGTLPDEGVDELLPLLQLATYYLMDNLKSACISKLACIVTPEKLEDVLVFAVENKMPELFSAILQLTPDKIVHEAHQMKKKEQNGCDGPKDEKEYNVTVPHFLL